MSEQLKHLQEIYDSLPKIKCQGHCYPSCGVIPLYQVEVDNIRNNGGEVPRTKEGSGKCLSLTSENKCAIYDQRPLVCRLFGMVKKLPCPYGCYPDKWVSDKQVLAMLKKLEDLSKKP